MSDLRPELSAAIDGLFPRARLETLPGDASTRRFHRLFLLDGTTRIVMDYGASFEGVTDDVRLAAIFQTAGLPVARVLNVLPDAGALVEEDLGDETLEVALSRGGAAREKLYTAAVSLAADVATRGTEALARSERAQAPALDEERFLFEMRFFLEHYVGGFLGRPEVSGEVRVALESLATAVALHPRVLCHRDYHSRNIMIRAGADLALVDIQDARWGPDTYDVASLLRDAYVDLDEAEVQRLLALYAACRPEGAEAALRDRFELTSAQRMLKALGTFGYQIVVLKRERYRAAVPRTVLRLKSLLPKHTQTAALADTLNRAGLFELRD